MRISDWSSDVCSADLRLAVLRTRGFEELSEVDGRAFMVVLDYLRQVGIEIVEPRADPALRALVDRLACVPDLSVEMHAYEMRWPSLGRASCRERGCQYW